MPIVIKSGHIGDVAAALRRSTSIRRIHAIHGFVEFWLGPPRSRGPANRITFTKDKEQKCQDFNPLDKSNLSPVRVGFGE